MAVRRPERRVVFFSRFSPDPDGAHGGCHRSYQVWWDCTQALGAEHVHAIPYTRRRPSRLRRWAIRASMARQNPLGAIAPSRVAWELAGSVWRSEPLVRYEAYLRTHGAPALCIVEDAVWSHGLVLANRRLGVPTWVCPQNLESLDLEGPLPLPDRLRTWSRLGDLANELRTLAACQARFAISRVETGFLGGVGLDTEFYPYRPVGKVREFFLKVRAARAEGTVEQGLTVLLGSATHAPTREGMQWFVEQVRTHGLPPKARVELVGLGTETLAGLEAIAPHGAARGRVSSSTLATLLARAHVVVIAHFSGFGALTRLAELPLAGIPVLAAAHATHAVEAPVGVERLPRQWGRWAAALEELLGRAPGPWPEPPLEGESVLARALAIECGGTGAR
jgi:hypothetical protein